MGIKIIKIDTPTLGDRSYLVHDGTTALIIDPQRDIDRLNDLLSSENVNLGAVAETHIHNDYVSGGLELSRHHGAKYLINESDPVSFEFQPVKNHQVIDFGAFAIKALQTPGHTYTHLAYVLINSADENIGVFTGGSLLHGATGRPDLLGWENARELAELQYRSAHLLSNSLDGRVEIFPTHGFGSFCSATPTLSDSSTIADEGIRNPVFLRDLQHYITATLDSLDKYPTYFTKMGSANRNVAASVDLSELMTISWDEVHTAIESGAWVVDLRDRIQWAKNHVKGSVSLGVDGSLASYLGWLYPYEKDLYLLSDQSIHIATAQRELVRIGIDRPQGCFIGSFSPLDKTSSIRLATFSELAEASKAATIVVLDVRQILERRKSHLKSSLFIPFYEVERRVEELPSSGEIWVHCASGYRAAAVVGFIESSGRTPVLINEDYKAAASISGLSIEYLEEDSAI